MTGGLDRAEIQTLLAELDAELVRLGARADIFPVGGAAIALAYDAAKRFLPGSDPDAARYYDGTALTVDVASPRYLLAMKLFASGVEADAEDIAFLCRRVGFSTVDEGLELVETMYRGRPVDPKVQYLLAEIVESLDDLAPAKDQRSEVEQALHVARQLGAETETARQRMMASARARRTAILDAHRDGMSIRGIAAALGYSSAVVQDAIRSARSESAGGDSEASGLRALDRTCLGSRRAVSSRSWRDGAHRVFPARRK